MQQTVDLQGAADLMKVHPKTVLDKINAGELPAAKVGRAYVMMTSDVLAHIQQAIASQTAARLGLTKGARPGRYRAGSRSASSSGATCAR